MEPRNSPAVKLSIVIRCRNEGKSLRQVYAALQAQHCSFPWEIVVVDNESEDDTREVCRQNGLRVVPLARKDFSYGRATNVGIGHARGELVMLLSSHAIPVGSHFLDSAVAPFTDPRVAAARCLWLGSGLEVLAQWHKPKDIHYNSAEEQQAAEAGTTWLREYPTAGCCVLRKSVWEKIQFDETLEANEDKFWASQVLAAGYKIRSHAEALWLYARKYRSQDRWRKDNREQLALYRITGRPPLTWPAFFTQSAVSLLTAPLVAIRYAGSKIIWNAHLVTIPWQARRAAKAGSLPEFEKRNGN